MGGSAGVLGGTGGRLLGEIGREPLVEKEDRNLEPVAQRRCEALGHARLVPALAAQRQRMPDHDLLRALLRDQVLELREPVVRRSALNDAERPGDCACGIGDGHAGACRSEVEREHLHPSSALRAASSASDTPPGFLPPASAIVGLPPPPPPMCGPSSLMKRAASSPRSTSVWSKLTTRKARPSSTDATIAPAAFSCRRSLSDRSRNGPPLMPFASTRRTSPSFVMAMMSTAASDSRGARLRARSSSPR